jgi:orotate phosphoribosyltransferase
MGPLDAIWHTLNFFAPALVMAVLAASAAKLLWRHELATVRWHRLAIWSAVAGITYGGLVVATAVALWLAGFVRR